LREAEAKREQLEEEIDRLNQQWVAQVEQIKTETEKRLTDNELREFRNRIRVLRDELEDKNRQI